MDKQNEQTDVPLLRDFLNGEVLDPAFIHYDESSGLRPKLKPFHILVEDLRQAHTDMYLMREGITGAELRKVLLPELLNKSKFFLEVAEGSKVFATRNQGEAALTAWKTLDKIISESNDLMNTKDLTSKQQITQSVLNGKMGVDDAEKLINLISHTDCDGIQKLIDRLESELD
jgi:hypothetical protein